MNNSSLVQAILKTRGLWGWSLGLQPYHYTVNINISENDVLAAINKLKNNFAGGPPLLFIRIKYSI